MLLKENTTLTRQILDRGYWFKLILNRAGIKTKSVIKYKKAFYSALLQREEIVPYAEEFITRLRKDDKKIGILTSADAIKGFKLKRIRYLGIDRYVNLIIIGGETYKLKKRMLEYLSLSQGRLEKNQKTY